MGYAYSAKKLFRHDRRPPWPPTGAGVRRTQNPRAEFSAPVRSTDAATPTVDSRTRQVTGAPPHLSYRPLPLRLATTTRRTRHSPSRICPFGRLVPFRAGCGPRASWLHRQRFGQRSVNAQRGPHTSHDNPHRPPVPRPPRRAFAPATAAPPPTHSGRRFSRVRAGRAASAPSEVRIAYWAMGVEPLRPERCHDHVGTSVFGILRVPRVPCPCAVCPCLARPRPGVGCLRLRLEHPSRS